MKILIIGDPHGNLKKIDKISLSKINLILLTGDLGNASLARKMAFENIERRQKGLPEKKYSSKEEKNASMQIYNSSIKLIKKLSKIAPVYTIFGNVELSKSEIKKRSKEIGIKLPYLSDDLDKLKNVNIINNKIVKIGDVKIGGLGYFIDIGWVKEFKPSDKKEMRKAKNETNKAKKVLKHFGYVDILLCHQPPCGFLDKVTFSGAPKHWLGKHAGSKIILDYIKKEQPKYVFCGHIHEGKGQKNLKNTKIVNVGYNGDYFLLNI